MLIEISHILFETHSRSVIMWTHTQSRSLPVLIAGIVSIILALSGGPSCSLALESRRLLQNDQSPDQGGGRYKLMHWSNPQAPHYTTEVSYVDRFKAAVQTGNKRLAALQGGAPSPSPSPYDPAPSPGPSGSFESPLYNLVEEYAMEITIGTPPHTFSGIADTGSDLVWVQCAGCDHCASQSSALFDPLKSSTYKNMGCHDALCDPALDSCSTNNTCSYTYIYGAGQTDGNHKAYETLTVTSTAGNQTKSPNFAFGCDLVSNLDLLGVDGLVGLGKGPLSFTTQLASLYDNKFSYCLVSIYDRNTTDSVLLFGDAAVPTLPTVYTPFVQNPSASFYGTETFYYISLTGIKVNGKAIDIPAGTFDIASDGTGGVVSDSGTAFTYIATAGYTPLMTEVSSLITYPVSFNASKEIGLDLCYDLAVVQKPTFPTVTMVFEGCELELPLQNAFIGGPQLFGSNLDYYCFAFADGKGTQSIFGNVAQQNFQVLHDRDAKVFGYAQVQCDTL